MILSYLLNRLIYHKVVFRSNAGVHVVRIIHTTSWTLTALSTISVLLSTTCSWHSRTTSALLSLFTAVWIARMHVSHSLHITFLDRPKFILRSSRHFHLVLFLCLSCRCCKLIDICMSSTHHVCLPLYILTHYLLLLWLEAFIHSLLLIALNLHRAKCISFWAWRFSIFSKKHSCLLYFCGHLSTLYRRLRFSNFCLFWLNSETHPLHHYSVHLCFHQSFSFLFA